MSRHLTIDQIEQYRQGTVTPAALLEIDDHLASCDACRAMLRDNVAAISCGIFNGAPVLDLDYEEDSNAEADGNFVLTGGGDIVEIQATGEKRGFTQDEFEALFGLARKGIGELVGLQKAATSK